MDQNDSKYKLWQTLNDNKLYTKNYDDFSTQFNNDKSVSGLYDALSSKKLYTKSKEDFTNQFFIDTNTTANKETKVAEKPVQKEQPYNFEKTFLRNIGADEWQGSVGRIKATPAQLLEETAKTKKPTEKLYKAPTGPIDITTQEDLKRSEESFDKFVEKRLKIKGVTYKTGDANYKKEKQSVLNDIKNGDIVGFVTPNGDLDFARSVGFAKGTVDALVNSVSSEFRAAKINTISDPIELADYANKEEELKIEDRGSELSGIVGGLPKLVGTLALGSYLGGATGGASLLAADAQWTGMADKRLELYYNKRNELIEQGMDKNEAEYQAASSAMKDAPAAAIPSAITNYVMGSMGGGEATPLAASREAFKKYIVQPTKIGALGAVQPLTEFGIEKLQGYDVKFKDALAQSGKGFTDFALMDLGMNVLMSPGKFSKTMVSAAKEYLNHVPKEVLDGVSVKHGDNAKVILSQLEGYNKSRSKVAPYMPQELVHHVAGLQEAIDNKSAKIKSMIESDNVPAQIIKTETEQLNALKERQDTIIKTGKGDVNEVDSKTGEPIVKEEAPKEPFVELTLEQKQANLESATPKIVKEEFDKIKQEYDTATNKPGAAEPAERISGEVSSELAPEVKPIEGATTEEQSAYDKHVKSRRADPERFKREYESDPIVKLTGESEEGFLRRKFCE